MEENHQILTSKKLEQSKPEKNVEFLLKETKWLSRIFCQSTHRFLFLINRLLIAAPQVVIHKKAQAE